ncbi:type IV pilus biogenesis/stability protein PilW [Vibrio bivalvicida]|uniref:Pilus assembly protein PilW n=1 Tax=Vibrio bivalvicida TaxID=1276888 RepID=A0A177XUV3_9VIBR|nr:type IV pilus biogenesis/stability protein PilW [Vibrio bivalvicida]OAJ92370.1 pilus assembly protein PilW [Vibrio bivalvicida]
MRLISLALSLILSGCMAPTLHEISDARQRSEARIALGVGYLEKGNMLKARENLEQAIEHAPNYYRAQLALAHYYEQVGELNSAEHFYNLAFKLHPKNGNVLNNYGTFLCKQGHYARADQYFNQAIAQPYYYLSSASYENAALCALKNQQTAQAIRYFKRALDYDPARPRSLLTLAKLEIEAGSFNDARLRLLKFQQRYGLQKPSLRLLVELERKAGNPMLERQYKQKLENMS